MSIVFIVQCVLKLSSSFKFYAFAHRYCFDYIFWISNYVIKTIALIPSSFIPIIVVSSTGTKERSVKRYQSSFLSSNGSHATVEVQAEAMGLIEAGWTQQAVANKFGVTTRVGEKVVDQETDVERPLQISQVMDESQSWTEFPKLWLANLSNREDFQPGNWPENWLPVDIQSSNSTVHKYLRNNIHAVPHVERTLLEKMLEAIFQQDGAPAHTRAKGAKEWCSNNLLSFWRKGTWPGNSPDLSLIENLSHPPERVGYSSPWVLKPWVATQNWVAAYFVLGQRER